MTIRRGTLARALFALCLALPAAAPAEPAKPLPGLGDLAWLAGTWTGEMEGGRIEEQWSAAAGGAMMGMFRWVSGDKVGVYEFLLFEATPEGLVLRFRHFEPGLIGWEDKDAPLTLRQTAAGSGEHAFEGGEPGKPLRMVYRRTGDRTMTVVLERTRDGQKKVQDFRYTRN